MSETQEITIALLVFGPLMLWAWWALYRSLTLSRRLAREGVRVSGRLTWVRGVMSAYSYRSTAVRYIFEAPDSSGHARAWEGRATLAAGIVHQPSAGKPVPIVYLPQSPHHHAIVGNGRGTGLPLLFASALTLTVALLLGELFA